MRNILINYDKKNQRLTRWKSKARLQLVLNGHPTSEVINEIKKYITGCDYCKYCKLTKMYQREISVCGKVGIKEKLNAFLMTTNNSGTAKKNTWMDILYCSGFEEKEEEEK